MEYLGIWEKIHNSDFNYGEFDLNKKPTPKRPVLINPYKGINYLAPKGGKEVGPHSTTIDY